MKKRMFKLTFRGLYYICFFKYFINISLNLDRETNKFILYSIYLYIFYCNLFRIINIIFGHLCIQICLYHLLIIYDLS